MKWIMNARLNNLYDSKKKKLRKIINIFSLIHSSWFDHGLWCIKKMHTGSIFGMIQIRIDAPTCFFYICSWVIAKMYKYGYTPFGLFSIHHWIMAHYGKKLWLYMYKYSNLWVYWLKIIELVSKHNKFNGINRVRYWVKGICVNVSY